MSQKKYQDFIDSTPVVKPSKKAPWTPMTFVGITCPHCKSTFCEIPIDNMKTGRAAQCLKHLRVCEAFKASGGEVAPAKGAQTRPKERKQTRNYAYNNSKKCDNIVTIYKVIYKPEDRIVYTGQTRAKLEDRLKQHSLRKSGCRLVRNAIRRYGMRKFAIEPIVRCHPDDADANESYYIIANNTLHPNGYNLRHGSKAGDDSNESTQVVPVAPKGEFCEDDPHACSDAMVDLAGMCGDAEESEDEDAEAMSFALLSEVHQNLCTGLECHSQKDI